MCVYVCVLCCVCVCLMYACFHVQERAEILQHFRGTGCGSSSSSSSSSATTTTTATPSSSATSSSTTTLSPPPLGYWHADVRADELAGRTAGFSPADLKALCNKAGL